MRLNRSHRSNHLRLHPDHAPLDRRRRSPARVRYGRGSLHVPNIVQEGPEADLLLISILHHILKLRRRKVDLVSADGRPLHDLAEALVEGLPLEVFEGNRAEVGEFPDVVHHRIDITGCLTVSKYTGSECSASVLKLWKLRATSNR